MLVGLSYALSVYPVAIVNTQHLRSQNSSHKPHPLFVMFCVGTQNSRLFPARFPFRPAAAHGSACQAFLRLLLLRRCSPQRRSRALVCASFSMVDWSSIEAERSSQTTRLQQFVFSAVCPAGTRQRLQLRIGLAVLRLFC